MLPANLQGRNGHIFLHVGNKEWNFGRGVLESYLLSSFSVIPRLPNCRLVAHFVASDGIHFRSLISLLG